MATCMYSAREAAERLAAYDLAEWQGPTGDCTDMRAGIALARLFLEEHPVDDGEPVTEAHLDAMGGEKRGPHLWQWSNEDSGDTVKVAMSLGYPTVTISNHDGRAIHLYGFGNKSVVGDIRRLLAAFGISPS